jgi:hypothetical protein
LDSADLVIETSTTGIGCPAYVRITHRPTGLSAEGTDLSRREARLRRLTKGTAWPGTEKKESG